MLYPLTSSCSSIERNPFRKLQRKLSPWKHTRVSSTPFPSMITRPKVPSRLTHRVPRPLLLHPARIPKPNSSPHNSHNTQPPNPPSFTPLSQHFTLLYPHNTHPTLHTTYPKLPYKTQNSSSTRTPFSANQPKNLTAISTPISPPTHNSF